MSHLEAILISLSFPLSTYTLVSHWSPTWAPYYGTLTCPGYHTSFGTYRALWIDIELMVCGMEVNCSQSAFFMLLHVLNLDAHKLTMHLSEKAS